MSLIGWAFAALGAASLPAGMQIWNAARYYRPAKKPPGNWQAPALSVLIPARNEARVLPETLEALQQVKGVTLEIIVLDDHSTDGTDTLVRAAASLDPRIRLEQAPTLPPGWCGKMNACQALGHLARHDHMLFLDADVRLAPDGPRKALWALQETGAALLSGVPRQETRTPLEWLLIPLIHVILLGFLPMGRMHRTTAPAYGAGCGQFMLTTRSAWQQAGGHAAIRSSLHDGLKLPRAYRAVHLTTRLVDATDLATCRMYRSASEVWQGLLKNACEGFAQWRMLPFMTVVLALGQVLPLPLALAAVAEGDVRACGVALVAAVAAWGPRIALGRRFGQNGLGIALHPVGFLLFLILQWQALALKMLRRPATWKARTYPA